jgi:hypothetical protein
MSRRQSRSDSIVPGSVEDRSIRGFLLRHNISKPTYYRLPPEVRAALETVYGPRTIRILPAAEAKFDRAKAKPSSTEEKLLERMRAKRVAKAKRAARASLAPGNHVSQHPARPRQRRGTTSTRTRGR